MGIKIGKKDRSDFGAIYEAFIAAEKQSDFNSTFNFFESFVAIASTPTA
jgi:hypothetical protein